VSLTLFCADCWADNPAGAERCRRCGAVLALQRAADYVEKLIRALDHPESATPVRSTTILGKIGDPRAIGPSSRLALDAPDPYIAEAAVLVLGNFESERVTVLLRMVQRRGAAPARRAAGAALRARTHVHTPNGQGASDDLDR